MDNSFEVRSYKQSLRIFESTILGLIPINQRAVNTSKRVDRTTYGLVHTHLNK